MFASDKSFGFQLQEALAEGAKERRLRVSLAEQVQYLTGATEGLQSSADAKLSKVAEMVLRSLSEEHRRCVLDLSMTAVEDSRGSSLNASQGPQQRTALGIVLRDTTIEAVVPGSPADLCGKVFPRDELIMVDGSTVSAVSAMGALRGDDSEGAVVSIVVRSATSGGPVQVKLFREGIAKVREQQAQEEELKQLEEQAQQAMALGEWPVVEDRVRRLAEARRITQQMHLEALCRVGEWAQALKQSLQHTIIKGRQAVLSVDACHQRVHVLQEAVEKELREDLGRGAADTGVGPVDELHLTIQQLERAAKLQQQEVKGLQALLQDAEEREAREVEARKKAEAQARAVREVENEMQKKMAVLEAQSGDVLEELGQFPAVVALRLGGLKFAKGREREALTAVEQQLQAEVSVALQVPSSSVQILCSYGEEEVVALLKLSSAEPSHSAAAQRWPGRSGRVLAEEMMAQVEDGGSVLRNSGLGKAVKGAQMHGPISELTARSMKHALAARDREWHWVEQELTAARGRVEAEVSSKSRDIGAMAVEVDARVAAARAAGREDGRQEMSLELNQKMQEQADALQTQWKSEAQEGKTREAELSSTVDALEESCRQKDSHVRALQGLLTDLQGRLEVVEGEVHAAEENQRQADQARVRSAELALQASCPEGPKSACLLQNLTAV